MVNPKNPKKSLTITTLPPKSQNSSNSVGESSDSLNLLARASSRAGKWVHSRWRSYTYYIARCSSRSVSASFILRNPSSEALSSSSKESEKESIGSDPRTPTASKTTTDRLSSKKVPSLKLLTALPIPIPEGNASMMSWDNVRHSSHQRWMSAKWIWWCANL